MKEICGLLKKSIKQHWGLYVLLFYIGLAIWIIVKYESYIYLCWNDNLDSNMAWNKMYYLNNCLFDREIKLPFLGGVSRDILTDSYDICGLTFGLIPTKQAYYILYVLHIAVSSIGFWMLGICGKKHGISSLNVNVCAVAGILYSMLGVWPSAYLGVALIPWWVWAAIEMFCTKKIRYLLLLIVFAYNTSFALIGVFILFYIGLFYIAWIIVRKRIDCKLLAELMVLAIACIIMNRSHALMALNKSSSETKGLIKEVLYTDTYFTCLKQSVKAFLCSVKAYHSGIHPLKYIAAPVCLALTVLNNVKMIKQQKWSQSVIIIDICVVIFAINSIAYGFDAVRIRQDFAFLSGFSFARFYWLNPFVLIICLLINLETLNGTWKSCIETVVFVLIPISIVINPNITKGEDMYNAMHSNYLIYTKGEDPINDVDWKWDDFYSVELFERIKKDVMYQNEWAVGFGLDPAVLEYNGIRTLDGYYSNYDIKYYEKWSKLMAPQFAVDKAHKDYWINSGGLRAYVYSEHWDMPNWKNIDNKPNVYLRVDKTILDELKCKYIFSRVEIKNANIYNMKLLGVWEDESSPYTIYVYENEYGKTRKSDY